MPFFVVLRQTINLKELKKMSEALDRLTNEVEQSRAATDSVLTLVQGLADQIREAVDNEDDDALIALADDLDEQQARIAEAVTANTPQAETPTA
jgi:50S ribosomal subunit-associated GTPase HflX